MTFVFIHKNSIQTNIHLNITYLLWNSTAQVNETIFSMADENSNLTINWTSLPDDSYTYNVTIVDVIGNINTTTTYTITLRLIMLTCPT